MKTRRVPTLMLTILALAGTSAGSAAQPAVTDTIVGSCVFHGGAGHCVHQFRYGARGNNPLSLREPSPEDIAEAREREKRWVARCRPTLRQDVYGVSRYVYAARGCEYGRDRD